MAEINGRSSPEKKELFWRGRMIFLILVIQPAPAMVAASSNSGPICIMAPIPARDEKGRYFTTQAMTSRVKVPYRLGIGPLCTANSARKMEPKAILGMR